MIKEETQRDMAEAIEMMRPGMPLNRIEVGLVGYGGIGR